MVSLSLMARLIEAIRAGARLVLVGDPEQLASIEAGAVLGDIVGLRRRSLIDATAPRDGWRRRPVNRVGAERPAARRHGRRRDRGPRPRAPLRGRRSPQLAEAIRRGDTDGGRSSCCATVHPRRDLDPGRRGRSSERRRHSQPVAAGGGQAPAARWSRRRAPGGAGGDRRARRVPGAVRAPPRTARGGRPGRRGSRAGSRPSSTTSRQTSAGTWGGRCSSTENDYELQLYNGDTGVIVQSAAERTRAAFERGGEVLELSPTPAGGDRHRVRDDDPQEPGLAVRRRRGSSARPRVAHPDPRAALHAAPRAPAS